MNSSNIRRIDGNKVKRGDLITLKKNVDEDLDNIMKMLEDLKNNVDHKLDILINMFPEEKAEKIVIVLPERKHRDKGIIKLKEDMEESGFKVLGPFSPWNYRDIKSIIVFILRKYFFISTL